jgi:hypothetical protein
MSTGLSLKGIRLHLAGAIPDEASATERDRIAAFVQALAAAVLRAGGVILHGSHPTFLAPLRAAAEAFVLHGGARDSLILVRSPEFAVTPEHLEAIEEQRAYAAVQIVPDIPDATAPTGRRSLVSMREWMAERCDAVAVVGGRHYDINQLGAGTLAELEEALRRGKPGFLVAAFGGAVAGLVNDDGSIFGRLRNGLSEPDNKTLSANGNIDDVVVRIVEQLKRLPLVRQSFARGRLFRILALDGGGLRGAFTAAVLAQWDQMLKKDGGLGLVDHFDLVAGTSTGAILAIGLAFGKTPQQILTFYKERGPEIFPTGGKLRHWLKSKHDSRTLRDTLAAILGNAKLSQASCRLIIPTVRAEHGGAETIVTPHSADRTAYRDMPALDAALASSAAPTYFDEAVYANPVADERFLDGGIWANNPVLPAIAEAVRYLQVPIDRIDVLSIGTLASESDFTNCLRGGKATWAPSSADLFFAAQERAATLLADCYLSPARHLRINKDTPTAISLDDVSAIDKMAKIGLEVGQDWFPAVRSRFLDGLRAPEWHAEKA